MSSKQEQKRKEIYEFYLANRSRGKPFTLEHFNHVNITRRDIYKILERADNESGHKRVRGSGRVAKIMTPVAIKRLKTMFDHSDRVSTRQAARKFGCTHSHIIKTLAKHTNINAFKKKNIPDRKDGQKERIKACIDRLYRNSQGKSIILDDESYFTLTHSTINGNNIFYSSDRNETPSSVKYRKNLKFEPKVLVWIAASEKGLSEPFFVSSGLAVNQFIYKKDCIEERLVPFINAHHADGNYVFWSDLASSHYAKSVIDCFEAQKINFVKKVDNPPAVPECRPNRGLLEYFERQSVRG